MTKVINLFAGSGAGKSTLAAGLFYEMKKRGLKVELVTEYVKRMAWDGIAPSQYDQPYIFGKQCKYESRLYNKVDFVVTDSPLLLSPIYEEYYNNDSIVLSSVLKFINKAKLNNVKHINFFLERNVPFDSVGRFENENSAKEIDILIKNKLNEWEIPFINIDKNIDNKIEFILNNI
jgi:nicotinamide riboside kinase